MRKFFAVFASFFFFWIVSGVFLSQITLAQPLSIPDGFSTDRILVRFKPAVSADLENRIHQQLGTSIKARIGRINVEVVNVPKDMVLDYVSKFKANQNVEFAEPDYKIYALEIPNDPYFSNQWGMIKIQAPEAWGLSHGLSAVKIAVVDTGIDNNHEDLAGKVVGRVNFTTSLTDDDIFGHGTHVAGIAAAITNNSLGVAGLGYQSSLMSVKVLDNNGSGYTSDVAKGITYAADNGANVINLSLGGSSGSTTLQDALNYAWGKGVVLACAAGNSGNSAPLYPAYYPVCISTAATDSSDKKASWSSYGSSVDVAAPGDNIFSTLPNHPYNMGTVLNYGYASGTSMATPHVAGLAGLLFGANPLLTNTQVRAAIENNADAISGTGTYWQFGRINAYKALLSFTSPVPTATPTATPTPTPTGIPTSTPTPTPIPAFAATITKHTVTKSWSTYYKGKINITLGFHVDNGSSSQVTIKELTDKTGLWKPYQNSTRVNIYINGKRFRPNMVWDSANEIATLNIGSLATLSAGDNVEVRMTLGNDVRGSHSITGQVLDGASILGQNLLNFTL
ncbi:MAG: S8 family peptidase [Candidatus Curtissbacteria bacterium]|nr:S8 family peptidase [Candidatus Curtissbacteria bacterium]